MNQLIKRLFSDSAAFAIATMGNKLAAVVLAPIYIRILQKDQHAIGDWGLTQTYTLILTYLCILGTDTALAYYFYDTKDEKDRRVYFTNTLLFSVGMCILFSVLSFLFDSTLSSVVYRNDRYDDTHLLTIATVATLGAIVIQHILAYARYNRRVWFFNIFSMAFVIGSSVLSVVLAYYMKPSVLGIFYGQLIGQGTVALILLWLYRKELTWKFSKPHTIQLIKYGSPVMISLLSFWIMSSISRPMLNYLVPDNAAIKYDANAIYEATVRIASFIVLITAPFQLAWRPFSMSIKDRDDAKQVYGLIGRGLLVFGTLAIMVLTFFIQPLYNLYIGTPGPETKVDLSSGYLYVWMLSLGTLLNVLHPVFGVGLFIKKQTKYISRIFILVSVMFLIGNFLLVPYFKIWGTVSMTAASYLIAVILIYRASQKVYPVEFKFGAVMLYMTVFLASMAWISYVQANHLPNPWITYVAAFVGNVAVVFITGLIPVNMLNRIGSLLPKLGGKK
ncbi:lipopolysaccharide biosynthesis protein [Baia soyae]|uniref:O-antigen/teichoic acid export membrane protein n=1 Tax=Baia soyae TaxID=1544746 RepID=A0A4R2RRU8_9BACL|nr:polysaccharide biosynthesis C-terminal domain-containing protein [Baia soyae]TCP65934.1 O-antigen/teichoic acid export membrane protein [Baia soyae]